MDGVALRARKGLELGTGSAGEDSCLLKLLPIFLSGDTLMTKMIAKVLLATLVASAAVACSTAPEKAAVVRKG